MDAYADASQKSQSYGALQANIGLIYAQELWGTGRREQALEVLRKAYEQARAGNVLAMPDSYGASYANALIRAGQKDKALPVIEHGLQTSLPSMKPLFFLLRGRALDSAPDLREALRLANQEPTREEICFELHRLEPEQHWLDQIKTRTPKQALRLMELSSPERALEIGHESLEQFRETFEQLPTSARAAALRSPSLQALIEALLEASLKANKPQDGAHCLAVWRAMQSQPGPVSPELEQLRAELTGLRAANDPSLADRLADTRAQFLLKLNQLRQLNPDMERSLSAQVSELLALQPQLDGQTLLVQYYLAPDGLYLQALTRDQQQLFKVKIEKARLLEHLQSWTSALRKPRAFTADERTASRQLYSHLVEPLGALRQGHPNLWIMPSAELWDLPFETLLDANDHYLLESAGCAYLGPSEAMQLSRPPAEPAGRWVGASNARLPGTLEEIAQLKNLFGDAKVTQSWQELKSLAGEARILHLATHSQARPEQATESYLEMAEGPIALDQIYSLSLPQGSLVVLSSCSGAVPQAHRERDLISLSSGFRAAGASSVIAALWPVDDQATVPFFTPMYQGLLKGQSRLQALRQAKLALVAQHPYFWAGFTLLGDPR
jgi:CHAT domain-containing protein